MEKEKYKVLYLPNHHRAFSNGTVYEHIVVAEKKIGRKLKDNEVVHHIDKNKSNNSPENILVFRSSAEHTAHHNGMKFMIDEEGIAYVEENINYCCDCGKKILNKSKRCVECNKKYKKEKSKCPEKNTLYNLLKNYSFVCVGKMYGVSDNAVKKWCRLNGIPDKSRYYREIKKQK